MKETRFLFYSPVQRNAVHRDKKTRSQCSFLSLLRNRPPRRRLLLRRGCLLQPRFWTDGRPRHPGRAEVFFVLTICTID